MQPKLLTYLKEELPSVAAAWDQIKQRIKETNDAVKARKATAKAIAAEEQAKIDAAPKRDVFGDGGVIVQVCVLG